MTDMDKFADLSRRIAYDPAWHLDEDTAAYLREDIDRALRDAWNAALEEAARTVGEENHARQNASHDIRNLKVPKP